MQVLGKSCREPKQILANRQLSTFVRCLSRRKEASNMNAKLAESSVIGRCHSWSATYRDKYSIGLSHQDRSLTASYVIQ